ncbi:MULTISPECIES: serine hydrolase domain-containing protein [Actinoplanes]|uniref:serine hydrolase domain-containing protein n=1 Tax=Actinoplanes TaxID=1865 RepID=UPI0005F2AFEA|nr:MULTISPECIES: serine hydrolase domain-containing protein [Actinoplanes]GLY03053.1 serine hydrolase [Actinoplanes sp. NBRC 101535]
MMMLPDLQDRLDDAARRHGVPGAAVAVRAAGAVTEAATGVADRGTDVAVTPDTLFPIGSITKTWTATLIMQLVADGLLDLDAPVRRYLPRFALPDETAAATVTVRHLLTHTGGFEGDLFEDTGDGDDAVERLVAFLGTGARQIAPPGTVFSYCNAGYVVLGALAARLRGGTWEQVLRRHVIAPLGVTHMALLPQEAARFRVTSGHADGVPLSEDLPRSNAPAGSTPVAAMRELVRPGLPLAAMAPPQVALPDLGARAAYAWGLGLMLFRWDGVDVVGHDGATLGHCASWRVVPGRDVAVAVAVNGGDGPALIDEVLDAVLAATAGISVPARPVPPASPVAAGPVTGRYSSPLADYRVTPADGGLSVVYRPQGIASGDPVTMRYVPLRPGVFVGVDRSAGVHPVIAFLGDGRYLFAGSRALPRH